MNHRLSELGSRLKWRRTLAGCLIAIGGASVTAAGSDQIVIGKNRLDRPLVATGGERRTPVVSRPGHFADGNGHDVVITSTAVHPPVLAALLHERVTFLNRAGTPVHVEFIGPHGEHEVFQVPGQIWAEFHVPGEHRYVVHLGSRGSRAVTGIVRIEDDPAAAPRECAGLTVEEVCIER